MFYILVCKYLTVKAFLEKDNMQKYSKNYKIFLYFYKIDFPSYIVTDPRCCRVTVSTSWPHLPVLGLRAGPGL